MEFVISFLKNENRKKTKVDEGVKPNQSSHILQLTVNNNKKGDNLRKEASPESENKSKPVLTIDNIMRNGAKNTALVPS